MPGMMDTVLNLGLNDETVEGLATRSGDRRFAYDSYRRFISMYSDVVLGVDHDEFEDILGGFKEQRGYALDTRSPRRNGRASSRATRRWSRRRRASPSRRIRRSSCGAPSAPCSSPGTGARAITYRKLNNIPEDWGTAVNVQAMVFGNMGDTSATGVAFTRNPVDRRAGALWRVPGQRPGRGRGGRHPHAAEHHRAGAHRGALRGALARSADARNLRAS